MRLRSIENFLIQQRKFLHFEVQSEGSNYILKGVPKAIDAIENLREFDFLLPSIKKLESVEEIYTSRLDTIKVSKAYYELFNQRFKHLHNVIEACIQLIQTSVSVESKNSIAVKLPDFKNLDNLSTFTSKLNQILNQLLSADDFNANIELKNFDSGSIWYEIALNSLPAVGLVGSAVWSAAVIRKKIIEGNIMLENLRTLKIKNEGIEDIKNSLKIQLDNLIKVEANNLIEEQNLKSADPEYPQRVMFCIHELAKMLNEGTEIHHSLMAPEEVKNLFPDFKNLSLMESKVPRIEDKDVS